MGSPAPGIIERGWGLGGRLLDVLVVHGLGLAISASTPGIFLYARVSNARRGHKRRKEDLTALQLEPIQARALLIALPILLSHLYASLEVELSKRIIT